MLIGFTEFYAQPVSVPAVLKLCFGIIYSTLNTLYEGRKL